MTKDCFYDKNASLIYFKGTGSIGLSDYKMFKITVSSSGENKEYSFSGEKKVVIGRLGSPGIDIAIDSHEICECHFTIEVTANEDYILFNASNDPFATLNGDPFGKRKLHDNDIIQIGQTSLLFEKTASKMSALKDDPLSKLLNQAIISRSITAGKKLEEDQQSLHLFDQEFEELESLSYGNASEYSNEAHNNLGNELFEVDEIEALVKEVEALEWEEARTISAFREKGSLKTVIEYPPSPYVPAQENKIFTPSEVVSSEETETRLIEPEASNSVKVSPQFDEEETSAKKPGSIPYPLFSIINFKWWLILITFGIIVLFFLFGSLFFYLNEKRQTEEIKAAQGISDIAMALMYARVNQIKPQNQNWSNPAFLKKNLGAILSPKYQILATIDAQGQLNNSPYLLRIYPNHDLSQFLVIAQPAASPFQSIFPRKALVVDSREMELRKLKDLRELNRLISNAKTFDHFDTSSSSAIIKEGELITLNSLTLSDNKLGFAPPRSLAILKPGAENRIYNAPRYYLFGERILDEAISLESDEYAQGARLVLIQDLEVLDRLPNLVLYSTNGMTKALHAQKALSSLAPQSNVLVGYLKLNPEGKVINSQLLMKHATPSPQNTPISETEIAANEIKKETPLSLEKPHKNLEQFKKDLLSLQTSREEALNPLAEKLSQLILLEIREPQENFIENSKNLWQEFLQTELQQNEKNLYELRLLLHDYSDVSLEELLEAIETSKFHEIAKKIFLNNPMKNSETALSELNYRFEVLNKANSFEELLMAIEYSTKLLTLKQFPTSKELINLQKKLHNSVFDKLSDFILSPENHLQESSFNITKRPLLESILQKAWIKDDEIKRHFIQEFDILALQNKNPN